MWLPVWIKCDLLSEVVLYLVRVHCSWKTKLPFDCSGLNSQSMFDAYTLLKHGEYLILIIK